MFSDLVLKQKCDESVVYFYSVDQHEAPSDGEIEFDTRTSKLRVLKTATGDDKGWHGEWLFPHIRRIVLREGSPAKRFVAVG